MCFKTSCHRKATMIHEQIATCSPEFSKWNDSCSQLHCRISLQCCAFSCGATSQPQLLSTFLVRRQRSAPLNLRAQQSEIMKSRARQQVAPTQSSQYGSELLSCTPRPPSFAEEELPYVCWYGQVAILNSIASSNRGKFVACPIPCPLLACRPLTRAGPLATGSSLIYRST